MTDPPLFRRLKRCGLRSGLTAGFAAIVFFTAALIALVVNVCAERSFTAYIEERQRRTADTIASAIAQQYDPVRGEWHTDYIHGFGMYALGEGYIIKVFGADGETVWDAEDHDMTRCHEMMTRVEDFMQRNRPGLGGGFGTVIYGYGGAGRVEITSYAPYAMDESAFRFIRVFNGTVLLLCVVAMCGAALAGFLFAGKIVTPIAQTIATIQKISRGNYSARFGTEDKMRELADLTRAVTQMAETLERQEATRKRLVGDIAHELRTPITNVSSHLELMQQGIWEPTPQRLAACAAETDRLAALVAELEKLHSAESENLRLAPEPLDLRELAEAVRSTFAAEIRKKSLNVTVGGGAFAILADRARFTQIIANLLSNAVKYTPDGGSIAMTVSTDGRTATFVIEDTGCGIAAEHLQHVFERFYRADPSRNRKTGGAGIGLTIARTLAEAHGATIEAESEPGKGSRFTVKNIPMA